MKARDIVKVELIGKTIVIPAATNRSLVGKIGKVIDETKHLLVIAQPDGNVCKLLKSQVTISFIMDGKRYTLAASHLVGRPEERLKKILKW